MTKMIMRALNIPTVEHIRVNEDDYQKRGAFLLKSIGSRLKYPVVIKPAHLGSSIGITVAQNETEAKTAIESAFELDTRVLIERYLADKQDINCAVYSADGEIFVSEPEEAFSGEIYTFEEKYLKKEGFEKRGQNALKGGVTGETREKIRSYAKTVYKRMNLRGVVRMDFLVSGQKVYLCEVNTVPGSLAYYLFCERVTDARAFFSTLIEDALRPKKQKEIVRTGILQKPMGNYK
jgi:D-alanine-D-alanine ligase